MANKGPMPFLEPYRRRHGAASLVQSVASPSQLVGPVVRKHWLDDPLGI